MIEYKGEAKPSENYFQTKTKDLSHFVDSCVTLGKPSQSKTDVFYTLFKTIL